LIASIWKVNTRLSLQKIHVPAYVTADGPTAPRIRRAMSRFHSRRLASNNKIYCCEERGVGVGNEQLGERNKNLLRNQLPVDSEPGAVRYRENDYSLLRRLPSTGECLSRYCDVSVYNSRPTLSAVFNPISNSAGGAVSLDHHRPIFLWPVVLKFKFQMSQASQFWTPSLQEPFPAAQNGTLMQYVGSNSVQHI
jgi:hypothetical protein